MKIKFTAIKYFNTNEEVLTLAESFRRFMKDTTEELPDGMIERGKLIKDSDVEVFDYLKYVQGRELCDFPYFAVNDQLKASGDWVLDCAWIRSGVHGNDDGYVNREQGIITFNVANDDSGVQPFIKVECAARCTRSSMRQNVLNSILKACGFTPDDWDNFQVDTATFQSEAPVDMKWYEG